MTFTSCALKSHPWLPFRCLSDFGGVTIFSPELKFLLTFESHTAVLVYYLDTFEEEYKIESKMFDLLKIDLDLFICDTPLGMIFDEYRRLGSIEDDVFAYELGVLEDSYLPSIEQLCYKLKNNDLDIYEPRQCYDKYERMFAEAVILINNRLVKLTDITLDQWLDLKFKNHKMGDDEEVLTYDELFDLEEENMCEGDEIAKVFKNDVDVLTRDLPNLRHMKIIKIHGSINGIIKSHGLMKNNGWKMGFRRKLLMIYVMNASRLVSKVDMLNGPLVIGEKMDIVMEEIYREWFEKATWSILKIMNVNRERFNEHEPIEDDDDDDDDDIGELDDYLIPNDVPYYVDEDEERFKERKSKLLGIPYKKPLASKSEKFEVIKYSLRPVEEYVAIKEYEYYIWVRTEENVSHVYQENFLQERRRVVCDEDNVEPKRV
nr:hypothetical protein [Tanacetum cinerariifolium]GEW39117.1 hypothetical protein [Tanacetum cinerariifolium]